MESLALVFSILSLVATVVVAVVVHIKLKSIYINLFELSKGLDVLWENQQKIIELTKIKSFIQLTNEEERELRFQVAKEKEVFGKKRSEGVVRSSEPNTDDKES